MEKAESSYRPIAGRSDVEIPATLRRQPLRAKPGKIVTQLHYARQGIVTPEMEFIALREGLQAPEFVRSVAARGRAIIPGEHQSSRERANDHRSQFPQKINANIGNSAVASSIEEEVEKTKCWVAKWGADTVMDLSTGKNIHETREWIIRNSPVLDWDGADLSGAGKVDGKAEELTWEVYRVRLLSNASRAWIIFTVQVSVLPATSR